jgi:hypothetical protein
MKKLATLFAFLGFAIQYVVPILLFGDIVPFFTTKEAIGKCLSGMGYVAVGLVLFFALKKIKEWILQKPKSIGRAIILSIPAIVWWVAIFLGLNFVTEAIVKFSNYWAYIIIFILLGRGCYIISEGLSVEEGAKK